MERQIRHEGISCDSCKRENFKGRRYKCLICHDYDLCGTCYDAGLISVPHTDGHPMQCILTRTDYDLYYQGETLESRQQPQSYACPHCSQVGFTLTTLQDHVSNNHANASSEVICSVCAARSANFNFRTSSFHSHLSLAHHANSRRQAVSNELVLTHLRNVHRNLQQHLETRDRPSQSGTSRRGSRNISTPTVPQRPEQFDEDIRMFVSRLSDTHQSSTSGGRASVFCWHLDHQYTNPPRQSLRQGQTVPNETSSKPQSTRSATLVPNVPEDTTQAVSSPVAPNIESNFLLPGLIEELMLQEESENLGSQRRQFVQELLFSAMLTRKESTDKLNTEQKK